MDYAVILSLLALTISLLITPIIRKTANAFNVVANTNRRTIHINKVPKLGGLGIFLAFVTATALYSENVGHSDLFRGLWLGGIVIVFLGFWDDVLTLNCNVKLIFQVIAATIAIYFGFKIELLNIPFVGVLTLGWLSFPLSLLWIIGITNALNLLDGLDGLAAGLSILLSLTILIVSTFTGNIVLASVSLILIFSILGFLKYNFPPAKIFMGDTGSLFLGFCLACLSIKAFTFPAMGTNLAALLIPFCIPLTDTTLSIIRRTIQRKHPFTADKMHIHHRLIDLGYSQVYSVLILYATSIGFGIIGIITLYIEIQYTILFLVILFFLFFLGLIQLNCFDFLKRRNSFIKLKAQAISSP